MSAAAATKPRSNAFSREQEDALDAVGAWLSDWAAPQVFRLFGHAGTGKTTLAIHLANQSGRQVLFGAFTGKAALVMRGKGCTDASTIHSMIYKPIDDEDGGGVRFILDPDSRVAGAGLVIIDECSMVDAELARDLLSFGTKVLVLGDPGQLPPVRGEGFFTAARPNVMLSEIHRQARDNPIIRMAMAVREGKALERGAWGASRVISRSQLDTPSVTRADQVLVGMNKTRSAYNARMRAIAGFEGLRPQRGDRLVCLRNNRERGLLNGGLWTISSIEHDRDQYDIAIDSCDDGIAVPHIVTKTHQYYFDGRAKELPDYARRVFDEFDFGYALTVHKAQGSQWRDVVLFDESGVFREDRNRWLYTGITRASETITVVQP